MSSFRSNLVPFTLFTFDRLDLKAPPADAFEEILGYSGDQRFVGFSYQSPSLFIEDGRIREVGEKAPWSVWYRSLGVEIHKHYGFGYDGRDPEHMLILDRKSRALYAGPVQAAHDALGRQAPRLETASGTPSQADLVGGERDLGNLLVDPMLAADCEMYHVKKKEGMERLESWLGHRR